MGLTIGTGLTFVQGAPFAAGTAAAPSITFVGDADTGFYNPAANTVGVAVGGAAQVVVTGTGVAVTGIVKVGGYAKASLPAAATVGAGAMAWCTDATGGAALVTSNGTSWTIAGTQTAP